MRPLRHHDAEWITDERRAPELEAAVPGSLVSGAVDGRDVDAVGNRMSALDRSPGVVLLHAELGFLARVPADRRRIDERLGALQGRQTRPFGTPLIPAHQNSNA